MADSEVEGSTVSGGTSTSTSSAVATQLDSARERWHPATTSHPSGWCESADVDYLVFNASNRSDAVSAVIAAATSSYNGADLSSVTFDEWEGDGVAKVTASYAVQNGSDTEEEDQTPEFSFSCSESSVRTTMAYSQKEIYTRYGLTAFTDEQASLLPIGWNGKAGDAFEAGGVDVPVGEIRLTWSKWMNRSTVYSSTWQKNIAGMYRKTNDATWKGYYAGELIFTGCDFAGTLKDRKVKVSFNFLARPNEVAPTIAGITLEGKTVTGNAYLWAISSELPDGTAGTTRTRVDRIFEAQVFQSASFSIFGL